MLENWKTYFQLQPGRYEFSMLPYGKGLPKQELYLGIPKGKKNFPTVVWFHGGGLTGDGADIPMKLPNGEYAAVGVRYRLSDGTCTGLDSLEDAVLAVAWVMKHIAEYGGDPDKIFVGGTSAGAWQAAMVGMNPALLAEHGCDNRKLLGLLLVSGQLGTHFQVKIDLKYKKESWAPVIDDYAPLNYVSKNVPPVILITGEPGLDMPTRVEENAYMAACLREVGHPDVHHYILGGHAHGIVHLSSDMLLLEFIARQLQKLETAKKGSGESHER